jgi:hypothetical protein
MCSARSWRRARTLYKRSLLRSVVSAPRLGELWGLGCVACTVSLLGMDGVDLLTPNEAAPLRMQIMVGALFAVRGLYGWHAFTLRWAFGVQLSFWL